MSRNGVEDLVRDGVWEILEVDYIFIGYWKLLICKDIVKGDFRGNYNSLYEKWCWYE